MDKWFWIIVTIIAFGLSLYLYFKFSSINNQTQLLYQDISHVKIYIQQLKEYVIQTMEQKFILILK